MRLIAGQLSKPTASDPPEPGAGDATERQGVVHRPGKSWLLGRRRQTPGGPRSPRRVRRLAVATVTATAVLTATASYLLTRTDAPSPRAVSGETAWVPAIDRPAVDRVVPADAVVDVKRDFGAKGDGATDDTVAIQAAISTGLADRQNVVYFPAGTYVVSAPLEWRSADGVWRTGLTLLGQNRDRTVLRLRDDAAGFGDPDAPRAVITTASQESVATDGSGNRAFHNFVFDLTIDVGDGNPGANGIDYLANNRGALRNVVVRAPAGSGHTGISMERRWPGPCLLQDVRVDGFARGISLQNWNYAVTAEHLRLNGQRLVGIDNGNNVLSVRDLLSHNTVPAVRSGTPTEHDGLLTLLDSRLVGGALGVAAVENDGHALLRGVHHEGYGVPVRYRGVAKYPENPMAWTSSSAPALSDASSRPLIERAPPPTPGLPDAPARDWVGVDAYGAVPGDDHDDTAAIQKALHAGSPVVYMTGGRYLVTRALDVPTAVRALVGFDSTVEAVGGTFSDDSTAAVFRVVGDTSAPLTFHHLSLTAPASVADVERLGDRPVSLEHVHAGGLPFRGTPGDVFLADVAGGGGWHFVRGHSVWARQLNAEQGHTKVLNQGGTLWVLGLKTEKVGTAIHSIEGARTEVLGGNLYPAAVFEQPTVAFRAESSAQQLTFVVGADHATRAYEGLASGSYDGASAVLSRDEAGRRGAAGSVVVLHTDGVAGLGSGRR